MKELYFKKSEPKEETWTKTMDLRWELTDRVVEGGTIPFLNHTVPSKIIREKVLQQKQISNLGNEKWVDVETVVL